MCCKGKAPNFPVNLVWVSVWDYPFSSQDIFSAFFLRPRLVSYSLAAKFLTKGIKSLLLSIMVAYQRHISSLSYSKKKLPAQVEIFAACRPDGQKQK